MTFTIQKGMIGFFNAEKDENLSGLLCCENMAFFIPLQDLIKSTTGAMEQNLAEKTVRNFLENFFLDHIEKN